MALANWTNPALPNSRSKGEARRLQADGTREVIHRLSSIVRVGFWRRHRHSSSYHDQDQRRDSEPFHDGYFHTRRTDQSSSQYEDQGGEDANSDSSVLSCWHVGGDDNRDAGFRQHGFRGRRSICTRFRVPPLATVEV